MIYLNNDVLLLRNTFQIYIKTCNSAYGNIPLYSYSTTSFTWKAGLNRTGVEVDFKTDDKLRLLLENNMKAGPAFVI